MSAVFPEHIHALRDSLIDLASQAGEQTADYRERAMTAQRQDRLLVASEYKVNPNGMPGKKLASSSPQSRSNGY